MNELTLGERLKVARGRSGKSQAEVAAESGMTGNTLGRIEADEVSPRIEQIELIAKAIGLAVSVSIAAVES